MHSSSKKVFFADYVFHVWENVYEPAEDTFLFAENLKVSEGDIVLDLGTGCGILGIIAARKASKVVAVDVNPHAIRCARENAELNGVSDKTLFFQGDLFTAIRIHQTFDVILFNAPYLPSEDQENSCWLEHAWNGGVAGRQEIDRFILEAPRFLKHGGHALLMQSTLANLEKTLYACEQNNLKSSVIAERDLPFFETLVLIKMKHGWACKVK